MVSKILEIFASELRGGNVGIGTTNPNQLLSVNGTIESTFGGFKFPDGTTQTTASANIFSLWTQSVNNIYYNIGNVGIGTSSPIKALDIIGNTHVTGNSTIDGNVGIGTTSPNSKLEVTNGYIELDTSSGEPPSADCDNADEMGRMKVDDSSLKLYVCSYDGSIHTWMSILGDSLTPPPQSSVPVIISLIADDPDDGDIVYSAGDTITMTFDSDTNTPGGAGIQTKTAVDNLFTFTKSLGQPYRGQWITADTFTITINSIRNARPPVIGVTTATPSGITSILSTDGTSIPSNSTSPVLSGDFGIQ